jgi:hypothetical protein
MREANGIAGVSSATQMAPAREFGVVQLNCRSGVYAFRVLAESALTE